MRPSGSEVNPFPGDIGRNLSRPVSAANEEGTIPAPMAPPADLSTKRSAQPLSADETLQADAVARRLHSELRELLASLPPTLQSPSRLAKEISTDRSVCQRIVGSVRGPFPGPGLLVKLPGAKGLQQFLDAMQSNALAEADQLINLRAAVDQFEQTVVRLAGSQSRLNRRLRARSAQAESARSSASREPSANDELGIRTALFDSAAQLTGRWSEAWVAVYVYHPSGPDRDRLDVPRVFGLVGHHARPDAVPLVFHSFSHAGDPRGDNAPEPGLREQPVVLEEFTTSPIPLVSTTRPGEFMVQSIDHELTEQSVDLMLAATGNVPHPSTTPNRLEELWALINLPVRRMVLDAYLHQDEARESIPSLAVHLWRPDFATDAGRRWQTRMPHTPRLQLLGQGIERAHTPVYSRQEALTRTLFEKAGLDPHAYVGVRCEVEYPIWRTGYCITFDFARPSNDEPVS